MQQEIDIQATISENDRRRERLNAPHNPVTGAGCVGGRFELVMRGGEVWHLPVSMLDEDLVLQTAERGSLEALARDLALDYQLVYDALKEVRYSHDFQFWAAAAVTIETKQSGHVPFVLNRAQCKLLASYEAQRLAGRPIRVVLLKARQWGGSTLTQIYMAWIQNRLKRNWNAFICALDKGQAQRIRGMYGLMASKYPADLGTITLKPYEGSSNTKWIPERECIVGVASVERPDAVRSYTYQMLHLSEVGLWPSTEKVNAESFAQGLAGALVSAPMTMCVLESTAKGIGNFFHRMWQRAEAGTRKLDEADQVGDPQGRYEPVFVSWFESEEYQATVDDPAAMVRSLSEYEWALWELGATLEQIQWYRYRSDEPGMDDEWRLKSEFPSTADEAFQSSGRRFFPKAYVMRARENIQPPAEIGNLYGDDQKGPAALTGLRFEPGGRGYLRIWTRPGQAGIERPGYRYTNRYAAFMDIGGVSDQADYTTIKIIDRIWTLWGGVPTAAAVWHGHLDQDLAAWEAARLCRWYDNALLAVEVNSLDKDHGDEIRGRESDQSYTVLDEIAEHYGNLFYRVKPEKDNPERYDGVLGFHTNKKSKPMILNALRAAFRDGTYEEKDVAALDECDMYEIKPDGSFGAVAGQHDDRVITTAGAVWLALQYMDPVREVPIKTRQVKKRASAASF